jgi:hypothetical protein
MAIYITDRHDVREAKFQYFEGPLDVILKHLRGGEFNLIVNKAIASPLGIMHVSDATNVVASIMRRFICQAVDRAVYEQGCLWNIEDRYLQFYDNNYSAKKLVPGDIIMSNTSRNAWEIIELVPNMNRKPFQPGQTFKVKNLRGGFIETVQPGGKVCKFREIK